MKLTLDLTHLFHEMQPRDEITLRSPHHDDVQITCAPDGIIEILVSGPRHHAPVVIRMSDYPDTPTVSAMRAAERALRVKKD